MATEPTPIATIRRAILKHRGGHDQTSDAGLLALWNSLAPETQAEYLAAVAEVEKKAPGSTSKPA